MRRSGTEYNYILICFTFNFKIWSNIYWKLIRKLVTWWPNWLHGNPRITSFWPNWLLSSFIWVKSRVVVPHKDATFSTKITFPFNWFKSTFSPLKVLQANSNKFLTFPRFLVAIFKLYVIFLIAVVNHITVVNHTYVWEKNCDWRLREH